MSHTRRFDLKARDAFVVPVFIGTLILLMIAIRVFVPWPNMSDLLFPAILAAGGTAYFIDKSYQAEKHEFLELFRQFNGRYYKLRPSLDRIACQSASVELSSKDKEVLVEYFNLCGEEFLFYETGFIDEGVWNSWVNGMKQFYTCPHIRELWETELTTDSYYGFTIEQVLEKPSTQKINESESL